MAGFCFRKQQEEVFDEDEYNARYVPPRRWRENFTSIELCCKPRQPDRKWRVTDEEEPVSPAPGLVASGSDHAKGLAAEPTLATRAQSLWNRLAGQGIEPEDIVLEVEQVEEHESEEPADVFPPPAPLTVEEKLAECLRLMRDSDLGEYPTPESSAILESLMAELLKLREHAPGLKKYIPEPPVFRMKQAAQRAVRAVQRERYRPIPVDLPRAEVLPASRATPPPPAQGAPKLVQAKENVKSVYSDSRTHWKLALILCFSFMVLTTSSVGVVWSLFHYTIDNYFYDGTSQVTLRMSNHTRDRAQYQTAFAESLIDYMAAPARPFFAGFTSGNFTSSMDQMMLRLLQTRESSGATYVYIATASGQFLGAGKYGDTWVVASAEKSGSCLFEYPVIDDVVRDLSVPSLTKSCPYDATKRGWYELALTTPGRAIWSPLFRVTSDLGAYYAVAASRVVLDPRDGKTVLGVVGVDMGLESLQRLVTAQTVGGTGQGLGVRSFILHGSGDLVAAEQVKITCSADEVCRGVSSDSLVVETADKIRLQIESATDPVGTHLGFDEVYSVSFVVLAGLKLYFVATLPGTTLLDAMMDLDGISAALLAVAFAFSLIFSMFVTRRICRFGYGKDGQGITQKELREAQADQFAHQARFPAVGVAVVVAILASTVAAVWMVGTGKVVARIGHAYIDSSSHHVSSILEQRVVASIDILKVAFGTIRSHMGEIQGGLPLNESAVYNPAATFPPSIDRILSDVYKEFMGESAWIHVGFPSGHYLGVGMIDDRLIIGIKDASSGGVKDPNTGQFVPLGCYSEWLIGANGHRNGSLVHTNCDFNLHTTSWYVSGLPRNATDDSARWGRFYRRQMRTKESPVMMPRVEPLIGADGRLMAVVGVDLNMNEISDFLSEMDVGLGDSDCTLCTTLMQPENSGPLKSFALLVSNGGCVLASSTDVSVDTDPDDPCSPLPRVDKTGVVMIADVAQYFAAKLGPLDGLPPEYVFSGNKKFPMLGATDVASRFGLDWHNIIVIPYWEMFSSFERVRQTIMLGSVGCVFLATYALTVVMRLAYKSKYSMPAKEGNERTPAVPPANVPSAPQHNGSPVSKIGAHLGSLDESLNASELESGQDALKSRRKHQNTLIRKEAVLEWIRLKKLSESGTEAWKKDAAGAEAIYRYNAALTHVNDALSSRPLRSEFLDSEHIRAYKLYNNTYYQKAVVVVICAHCMLAFWEMPASDEYPTSLEQWHQLLGFEVFCVFVYILDNTLFVHQSGATMALFKVKNLMKLVPAIFTLITLMDVVVALAHGPGMMRVSRILRPSLLLLRVRGLKSASKLVLATMMEFLDNMVLLLSLICCSSVIGMAIFRDKYGWEKDVYGFWNFVYSALTMFHLLTGEPYPDVLVDIAMHEVEKAYFIIFVLIGSIFFVPGIIAKFYELYKKERVQQLVRSRIKEVSNLLAAYQILPLVGVEKECHSSCGGTPAAAATVASDEEISNLLGGGVIDKKTFVNFLLFIGNETGALTYRGPASLGTEELSPTEARELQKVNDFAEEALVKFAKVDSDDNGTIDRIEFCDLCRSLLQHLEKPKLTDDGPPSAVRRRVLEYFFIKLSPESDFEPALVFSNVANLVVAGHILANAINGVIYMNAFDNTWAAFLMVPDRDFIDNLNVVFLALHLMDIVLKMIAWTPRKYWAKGAFQRFDLIVIFGSVAAFVVVAITDPASSHLVVISVLPTLRIFTVVDSTSFVVHTFLSILPSVTHVGVLVISVMYAFAIVGMESYSSFKSEDIIQEQRLPPDWALLHDRGIVGFTSMATSMYSLFQLYLASNYTGLIYPLASYFGDVAHLFFCTYIFIAYFLLSNLFIGIVLDAYVFKLSVTESEREEFGIHQRWVEFGRPKDKCFLCLRHKEGGALLPFSCKHTFHRTCIMYYEYKRGECPQCRCKQTYGSDNKLLDPDNIELEIEMFGGAVAQQVAVEEVMLQKKEQLSAAHHNNVHELERTKNLALSITEDDSDHGHSHAGADSTTPRPPSHTRVV